MGASKTSSAWMWHMKIISRNQALALGLKRYFTGKPCKHGHVCERIIIAPVQTHGGPGDRCLECSNASHRAYGAKYRARYRERENERWSAYRRRAAAALRALRELGI